MLYINCEGSPAPHRPHLTKAGVPEGRAAGAPFQTLRQEGEGQEEAGSPIRGKKPVMAGRAEREARQEAVQLTAPVQDLGQTSPGREEDQGT